MATDKNKALGMNVSTASAQLKKLLMFKMMQELELDECHQCSERIELADQLSVEHKVPWLSASDPKATFFDLNNVAFSHLSCNSGAGSKKTCEHDQYGCLPCKKVDAVSLENAIGIRTPVNTDESKVGSKTREGCHWCW